MEQIGLAAPQDLLQEMRMPGVFGNLLAHGVGSDPGQLETIAYPGPDIRGGRWRWFGEPGRQNADGLRDAVGGAGRAA